MWRRPLGNNVAPLVTCVLVLTLTACTGNQRSAFASWRRISTPIVLPAGYGPPINVTSDPTKIGVWVLGPSQQDDSLFFWDPQKKSLTRRIRVAPPIAETFTLPSGPTISPNGTIWLAEHTTLIRVNAKTGAVSNISVPGSVANRYDVVEVLAADSSGNVAVSVTTAPIPRVFWYSERRHRYSLADVPSGPFYPNTVIGFLADGTLVAAGGHTVSVVARDGHRSSFTISGNAKGIESDGTRFVVTSRDDKLADYIYAFRGANLGLAFSYRCNPTTQCGEASLLPSGNVVASTRHGLVEIDQRSSVRSIKTDNPPCPAPGSESDATNVNSQPRLVSHTCEQEPWPSFTTDRLGNIWYWFAANGINEVSGLSPTK